MASETLSSFFFLPLLHFIQLSNNILQPPLQTYTSKYQNIAYILAAFIHKADVATQTKKLRIYLHTTNAFPADYNVTLIITFNCNLRNSTSKNQLVTNSLKKIKQSTTHKKRNKVMKNHLVYIKTTFLSHPSKGFPGLSITPFLDTWA